MAGGKLSNEWFTGNHPWPLVNIFLMKMVYCESPMACGKHFSNEWFTRSHTWPVVNFLMNGLLGITHGLW